MSVYSEIADKMHASLRLGGYILISDGDYFIEQILPEYEIQTKPEFSKIDYLELERTVRNLYPNRVRRPGWETWFFMENGLNNFRISFDTKEQRRFCTQRGNSRLDICYQITAQKPYIEEEMENHQEESRDLRSTVPQGQFFDNQKVLTALSNTDRIRMVHYLTYSPMNVSQLCELTKLPQNLVSYNLKLLKESGIRTCEKCGREMICRISNLPAIKGLLSILQALDATGNEKQT